MAASRDELVDIARRLIEHEGSKEELSELFLKFSDAVPHPEPLNLLFHTDLEPEEVVERALSYRAIPLGQGTEEGGCG